MDIEEIEEGHDDDDEASMTSQNTIEKLAAHGQFEIADDEASSDEEEEDYASLLQKAEAEAAEAAARLAATQSAVATPRTSAPPSRPNTGAARVLFGGSNHGTPRGGGTPRLRPSTAESAAEDVVTQLDTDQEGLLEGASSSSSAAATEKRKSKNAKKKLAKTKTRRKKKPASNSKYD